MEMEDQGTTLIKEDHRVSLQKLEIKRRELGGFSRFLTDVESKQLGCFTVDRHRSSAAQRHRGTQLLPWRVLS
jgi:hypothetical protein